MIDIKHKVMNECNLSMCGEYTFKLDDGTTNRTKRWTECTCKKCFKLRPLRIRKPKKDKIIW
jgi:hypothetical protein